MAGIWISGALESGAGGALDRHALATRPRELQLVEERHFLQRESAAPAQFPLVADPAGEGGVLREAPGDPAVSDGVPIAGQRVVAFTPGTLANPRCPFP